MCGVPLRARLRAASMSETLLGKTKGKDKNNEDRCTIPVHYYYSSLSLKSRTHASLMRPSEQTRFYLRFGGLRYDDSMFVARLNEFHCKIFRSTFPSRLRTTCKRPTPFGGWFLSSIVSSGVTSLRYRKSVRTVFIYFWKITESAFIRTPRVY